MLRIRKKLLMFMLTSLLIISVMSIFGVQIFQVDAQGSPFTDVEVTFIVYPDGRVVMSGALNYTDVDLQYTGPATEGVMAFSKSDGLTSVSTNCTFTIPPEVLSEVPFDSIDFTLSSTGSDDVFDTEIDCSVVLSEVIVSEFPFNMTDFTATGEYDGNLLNGTVTLHMLSGFALGDLDIDFKGNITDLSLSGSTTVIYGTYYDWKLNETILEDLIQQINSTIPGRGPESLYNMTNGILECTTLNITKTPYNTIGATIDFDVAIHGDFLQMLAYLLYPPYDYPESARELVYSALNATYSSVESASFELAYAYGQKKASMSLSLVVDSGKLTEDLISLIPETAPPEIVQLMEALLETRYCSVKAYECSLSYGEDKADLKERYIIEGDLNAELNFLKSTLLTYVTDAAQQPLPWEVPFLNETEIDVSDYMLSFNLDETSYSGYLGGLAVLPPQDVINATSFKLERFFNLTADAEFPGEGQRLKVTIVGGCNATHTVTLSRPETETVPEPTHACDNRIMVWDNQTLIDLKDLIFNIQPETGTTVCDVTNPELICAENPFVVNATETPAATLLSITEISKPVTIVVKNVTTPPEGVEPPSGTFKVLGNYVEIVASETDVTVNATIRIYYTPEQLEAAGLDENTLKIHYWDATLDKWVAVESHVNKAEHYVWAVIDHFSLFAIIGQPPSPIWTQLWFWAVIGSVIVVVIAVAVYAVKRRKPPTPTLPESIEKV